MPSKPRARAASQHTVLDGQGHSLGRAALHRFAASVVIDPGQDAVDVSGMTPGLAVYCGYFAGAPGYRRGSYSNMTAIKTRFPGKKYICVGTDVIDIEPGLAVPADGPAFVQGWEAARAADPGAYNISKPMLYADLSEMSSVRSELVNAGITRSRYYLWLAEWNGGPIPSGYDGIQNRNTAGYDGDLFYDYIFTPAAPPPPPPPPPPTIPTFSITPYPHRTVTLHWAVPRDAHGAPLPVDHFVIQSSPALSSLPSRTPGTVHSLSNFQIPPTGAVAVKISAIAPGTGQICAQSTITVKA